MKLLRAYKLINNVFFIKNVKKYIINIVYKLIKYIKNTRESCF